MGVERDQQQDHELRAEVDHLRIALTGRDLIGQAKGILMERHGISADAAFDRLVRISQTTNTKLHEVAALVAAPAGDAGAGPRVADGLGDDRDAGDRQGTGVD